jgi:hypothetical protein
MLKRLDMAAQNSGNERIPQKRLKPQLALHAQITVLPPLGALTSI